MKHIALFLSLGQGLLLLSLGCGDPFGEYQDHRGNNSMGSVTTSKALDSGVKTVTPMGLQRWSAPLVLTPEEAKSNPALVGKSLKDIVNSVVTGRADGKLCSSCHNSDEEHNGYAQDVGPGQSTSVSAKSMDPISQRPWIGAEGWAEHFIANATKPDGLKAAFAGWKANGYAE